MVRFEVKGPVAIATLDRENALNSLNLEMVTELKYQLADWTSDRDIALIVLRGAGPKAFCAGGDVKTACQKLNAGDAQYGADFFRIEYELDYAIHVSPKPVVVLGHGIVMGGGIGLFAGATVRVATESSLFAMPEISIGLFPDVGGSFFLNRMPGRLGLFLALTGARFNATDALFAGLADAFLPDAQLENFVSRLVSADWSDPPELCKTRARRLAAELSTQYFTSLPAAQLQPRAALIDATLASADPLTLFGKLSDLAASDDPWLAKAAATFVKGSPTSAHLIVEQLKRGRGLALKDCFAMELKMALQCCRHHDFSEGVRAVLIDKDHTPRWQPARWQDVDARLVAEHFDTP